MQSPNQQPIAVNAFDEKESNNINTEIEIKLENTKSDSNMEPSNITPLEVVSNATEGITKDKCFKVKSKADDTEDTNDCKGVSDQISKEDVELNKNENANDMDFIKEHENKQFINHKTVNINKKDIDNNLIVKNTELAVANELITPKNNTQDCYQLDNSCNEENCCIVKQESVLKTKTNNKDITKESDGITEIGGNNINQINVIYEDEESEEIVMVEESDEMISGSQESLSVIQDNKCCDSDVNSENTRTNNDVIDVNISSNSQFYEDSKLDYALKIDDNDTLSDIDEIKTDSAVDSEDSALGSLPSDVASNEREEGQDRSDGSDSGLGSETTEDVKISNFGLDVPSTSGLNEKVPLVDGEVITDERRSKEESGSSIVQPIKPQRSSLKRKCEDDSIEEPQAKKKKDGLRFDKVTVFYFQRAQGFSCVPSQGGSTLGMEWQHSHMQNFTLAEHAIEQRRLHRQILQQLKNERHSLQGASLSSSEDSDSEEEASDMSESELDLDSYYFLQPVPTRQRRALLRAAGVRKIEAYEKDECRDIRTSREFCGCACKGSCNPETCSCSLAGIKCQVDRLNFPCGCSRDCCKNTTGRIEFNPIRVRTHFIHTLMRIGLEKKNEEEAAKRHWAESAQVANTSSAASTAFETNRTSHEDGLVRDVNLTPRVEVESCVNAGSFSNVHCDMNNASSASSIQENMSYTYGTSGGQGIINSQNVMQIAEIGRSHHADPYSASMLQGKGPPHFIANNMGFESIHNNIQRFPCDVNYTYGSHENHHFKSLQSFSASSFEEFAHAQNSHMAMFGNYGHYGQNYMHKQNSSHLLQYHQITQNHYDMYKTETVENKDSYYAPLMSLPYHSNKLQSVDDENWYSRNTLMAVEEQTQDAIEPTAAPCPAAAAPPAAAPAEAETTENFGELIKKTMVESVSVVD